MAQQARLYDKKHRPIEFDVGSKVLLSTRNLKVKNVPAKLESKFCGPFVVTEQIGQQAYRLKLPDNWLIHDVFHISLLKEWKAADFRQKPDDTNVLLEDENQPVKVEKILRWRTKKALRSRDIKEYLVLWSNRPAEEASWIMATEIPQLQAQLEKKQPEEE